MKAVRWSGKCTLSIEKPISNQEDRLFQSKLLYSSFDDAGAKRNDSSLEKI